MNALKRRARRRRLVSLDGLKELPANPDEPESDELDPSVLEDALLGLPPTQQVVIRMKYYLGLSFREIGEALAISQNTAASRCRYGLETLRNALRRRT
jgi:RNA polymerase sigma-70 factor (ECF subfamily)